jgi:hypothetical protein
MNQYPAFIRELIIKPEERGTVSINPEIIRDKVHDLEFFDIIGVTEKELGASVKDRMISIANMRLNLDEGGVNKPIHVFGSLDPITTPLYYLAGAEIFDGLTWLKFIFHEGSTYYRESEAVRLMGPEDRSFNIWVRSVYQNYHEITKLEGSLRQFRMTGRWSDFGRNEELLKTTYEKLVTSMGGVI